MTAVAERHALLADYEAFESTLAHQPDAVRALRRRGLERFEALGFPTTRQEEWRSTNVTPIAKHDYVRAGGELFGLATETLEPFRIPDTLDLVFVNGRFVPELSDPVEGLPDAVYVGSLADAWAEHGDTIVEHLGQHASTDHPFVALNTAYIEDGAFVYVPRNTKVETTLHLLFVGTAGDTATVSYPRNLVVVGESSEVTFVESYAGFEGRYFTCPVTEIVGGANSVIDHYRLGEESIDAYHLATLEVNLGRDANHFTHSVNWGGAIVRNDIRAYLGGEGINCTLNGLYLGRGKQLVDHHMWVDHAVPHCNSYELFKGILEDQSRAVFNGRIKVHEDAQKTDAKQSSQHLLLSDSAIAHSNPQLEIFADDVRCTHGSTTGHLDDEAIFYLRSRGIGEEAARSLLTYAFAAEVLDEFRLETVRKDLEEFLFTRLPKGHIVRQAV